MKDNTVRARVYLIFIATQERTKLKMQLPILEVSLMDRNRKLGRGWIYVKHRIQVWIEYSLCTIN